MPCSVPTMNLVGWGWEEERAAVSRLGTEQGGTCCSSEPWDLPRSQSRGFRHQDASEILHLGAQQLLILKDE